MDINNIYNSKVNKNIYVATTNSVQDKAPENGQSSKSNLHQDKVSISPEAKTLLAEMKDLEETNEKETFVDEDKSILEYMENIRKQSTEDDPSTVLLKCIIIATRIINGHDVPLKDQNFLAENQPEMYLRAILLRQENEDPVKHDSLIKDDNKEQVDNVSASDSISEALSELPDE